MPLSPSPAAAPGFAERIGRAVFFPHKAVRALSQGEAGGLRDTALLFLPRLLVSDTQRLSAELAQVQGLLEAAGERTMLLQSTAAGQRRCGGNSQTPGPAESRC